MNFPKSLQESFIKAQAIAENKQYKIGLVGKPTGYNTYIIQAPQRGKVYVRLLNDDGQVTSITTAINMGSNLDPFIRQRLKIINGELTIVGVDPSDAVRAYGNRAPQAAVPPHTGAIGGGLDDYVDPSRFTQGLVTVSEQGGMYVTILAGRYGNGSWDDTDLEIDSADIPVAAYTSVLALIYYNPQNNSHEYILGNSSTLDPSGYTQAHIDDIPLERGMYPLGAVTLYYGQTAINDGTARILSARQFINHVPYTVSDRVDTDDNTATAVFSISIEEDTVCTLFATITSHLDDFSAVMGGTVAGVARRATAGNVTLVGTPTVDVHTDSGGSPTFDIDVDVGSQTMRIMVTGVTAEDWVHQAVVTINKVGM